MFIWGEHIFQGLKYYMTTSPLIIDMPVFTKNSNVNIICYTLTCKQCSEEMQQILRLARRDGDEWVRLFARILAPFPHTQTISVESCTEGGMEDVLKEVTDACEGGGREGGKGGGREGRREGEREEEHARERESRMN